jgi:hypothetical protein
VNEPISGFFVQLSISLLGAGVGALLGAYFGLRFARNWDRQKYQEQIDLTREKSISNIITELKAIESGFSDAINQNIISFPNIDTFAFDSEVNSGNFSLLPNDLQTKLTVIYNKIKQANATAKVIVDFYISHQPPNGQIKSIDEMKLEMDRQGKEIQTSIGSLLKKLNDK